MSDDFAKEVAELLNEDVVVEISGGERITGRLKAFDPRTLSIVLEDVIIGEESYRKVIISGDRISRIFLREKRIDMEKLKEAIEKFFPKLVEYRKDIGVILVMNRIKVTDRGVEGPPGPATERVKKIFEDFVKGYKMP